MRHNQPTRFAIHEAKDLTGQQCGKSELANASDTTPHTSILAMIEPCGILRANVHKMLINAHASHLDKASRLS